MKIIHIKSQTSVALPIYTSDLSHLAILESKKKATGTPKKKVRLVSLSNCSPRVWGSNNQGICFKGAAAKKKAKKNKTKDKKQTEASVEGEEKKKAEEVEEGEDEEIPQLVPIPDTPSKKPKLEVSVVHVYF